MKRGDLVTIAVSGNYGKPRPALVVQANAFHDLGSVTVLRLTSAVHDAPMVRITVSPTPDNGLHAVSQVMIDRAISVPHDKVGSAFGRLDTVTMRAVNQALTDFLGLTGG